MSTNKALEAAVEVAKRTQQPVLFISPRSEAEMAAALGETLGAAGLTMADVANLRVMVLPESLLVEMPGGEAGFLFINKESEVIVQQFEGPRAEPNKHLN